MCESATVQCETENEREREQEERKVGREETSGTGGEQKWRQWSAVESGRVPVRAREIETRHSGGTTTSVFTSGIYREVHSRVQQRRRGGAHLPSRSLAEGMDKDGSSRLAGRRGTRTAFLSTWRGRGTKNSSEQSTDAEMRMRPRAARAWNAREREIKSILYLRKISLDKICNGI